MLIVTFNVVEGLLNKIFTVITYVRVAINRHLASPFSSLKLNKTKIQFVTDKLQSTLSSIMNTFARQKT